MRHLTVQSEISGHRLYVEPCDRSALPEGHEGENYTTYYTVKNHDADGVVFFYLGKGYRHPSPEYANDHKAHDPHEIVAIFPNGKLARGSARTFAEGCHMAQRLGWLCAR